ncbi:uncharacterized protein LOC106055075 isoform X2 [Biomphalaria glabrata]|uniref:Uncharacterized protein LOC106055075 isoform X2 n=1 Tax=Biomphalaria glabrata TaxID=6526 RepID=A0A9U8DYW3_BIOGL|nr:uncharacterized protein LOC106055075 isoform X2 [Biomphalaria glabrata]
MNYDTPQYALSHGLASAPQLHVQQQQHHLQQHQLQQHQFQQQQHIFQPQYNHAIPTSNVYQFQFAGGGSQMFQQKEAHHMGLAGGMQQRINQHGMVSQPFIKQGMPLGGMEGIHVVNGLDGMIYSHPKNSLKIITNPDNRMMQQTDGTIGMQQTIVGVDMMGNSNFLDHNVEVQQQPNVNQGSMFTYNNKHFTGWLQPQNINTASSEQCQAVGQSSLPSFNHLWSQFQHQKQVGVVQHHQHLNQYQQPQQFHQQPALQTQQFTGASFQAVPGIQMVKMQQQKPQQITVPVSMQSVQHLPSQFHCFSPPHINLMSSKCMDKDSEMGNINSDKGMHSVYSTPSINIAQSISSPLLEHKCTTAVTYTISGPPKVTVTLDSLTQCETFPPNGLLEKSSEMSFNSDIASSNLVSKGKSLKNSDNIALENSNAHNRQWQPVPHQRTQFVAKPLFHTSSTGSSLERSSSESSNFSSPPYAFTPPSSTDSLFSPVSTLFSKVTDFPSPKTMAITTSPPVTHYLTSPLTTATQVMNEMRHTSSVAAPALLTLSLVSTCTTTVTTTVASSYHSVALTTTSVTSTTPCSKESTGMASAHSDVVLNSNTKKKTEHIRPGSPELSTKEKVKKVKVPYSWQRKLKNGMIEYLSPSGVSLQSVEQICSYLLSDITCKCGLQCPLHVDKYFSFDPEVESQPWSLTSPSGEDLQSLCHHSREIVALAAFHSSQAEVAGEQSLDPILLGKKRQERKSVPAGDELIVSPLKRLKSSITKAVNKHAMYLGNTQQIPFSQESPVQENCLLGNAEVHVTNRDASSLGNPAMIGSNNGVGSQPANFFTRGSASSGEKEHFVCKTENKQTFQVDYQQAVQTSSRQMLVGEVGNEFCDQRRGREPNLQSPLSRQMAAKEKDISQLEHQSTFGKGPSMFYQNQKYLNSAQSAPQVNEGFKQSIWQCTSPSRTSSFPHFQSSPKPTYQSTAGFNHANYVHSHTANFVQHSTPQQQLQQLGGQAWLDPKKIKSKRPKSKKEKQKQINSIVDRSSPCAKLIGKAAQPSTAVSFLDNPTVFVEQQTAIINNSIASCQLNCSSPTPPRSDTAKQITFMSSPDPGKTVKKSLFKPEEIDLEIKSESDDQKSVYEMDSSKSFSDTHENNDSAYLSQVGSSQDRSDSETCLDNKSDVYDFNMSEDKDCKHTPVNVLVSEHGETDEDSSQFITAQTKSPSAVSKLSEKKISKLKSKVKPCQIKKEAVKQEVELIKKMSVSSLNGDVTQLLSSNNLNITALQQVLAQCNNAETAEQLKVIQQAISQGTGVGLEFPASSLLSAAARAQLNLQNNGASLSTVQINKNEGMPTTCISMVSSGGAKSVVTSSTACGSITNATISQLQQHPHQPSPCIQQLSNNPNLLGNMMQLQQLTSGNFTMNMILPVCGQGQTFTSDSIHTATFGPEHDHKTPIAGSGNMNPLMAQGILTAVSRSPELGSQLKLSVASVIPSSLGPQCTQDTTMLLNNFGPRMIMNNAMPPVSVSVVTNVTKSLAQVVPTIGINQTVFNTQQVTPQLINAQQGGPQIINTSATGPGAHMMNTSQGGQVVGSAPQGAQLVNNTSQTTQIMNALSVQSLNNQLLITNPIQQVSPTNSISQLSPAMAAQILAQGQQHLQQMSPSFLQGHLQKQTQNAVIGGQNMFASVSLPTLTVTSDHNDVLVNSIAQSGIINNFQNNARSDDQLDKAEINISQVKDTVSMANPSLYASTSQPVFVIPQPNANPMMQVLGTSQQLGSATNLTTDLNNLTQIFSQSIDHNQLQNLMSAGFNPINFQQMMGAVNLTGVQQQQQQQQLQLLQLQQLLLQQIQNQGQNIHGISLPLNQNSSPNQATLGTQTIMNTVVPQRSLHLNSVMDINALHSSLSPVAQSYQNQLSPATAQLQHISPAAITVHQVTSVNTGGAVGVIHNTGVPGLMQASAKSLPSVVATVQSQQIASDQVIPINKTPTLAPSGILTQESSSTPLSVQTTITSTSKTLTVPGTKLAQSSKTSKSKSTKSKKTDSKKLDPESERNEEDIAATVQQILAEAVQQQKELILAAKNQPPPPPKSKSKKSQVRAKSSLVKEHDLGKLFPHRSSEHYLRPESYQQLGQILT